MHCAVLCSPDSWYFRDLSRAADGRHTLTAVSFRDLAATLGGSAAATWNSGDCHFADVDAVLVRTMPPGSLEQVVFRMDVLLRLEAGGTKVVNPPRAIECAVDKYLAQAKLQSAGLLTPETVVCQTTEEAMPAFERLGRDVVIKPLFGSEGRGITRVSDEDLALRAFKLLEQMGAVIYLQRFIEHEGCDLRLLVIGGQVFGIRRRHPTDWRTNISRGAVAEPIELNDELIAMARRAAAAIGAPLAGVDLLPARDGRCYCLEVNAVPGWRAAAKSLDADIAASVLQFVQSATR